MKIFIHCNEKQTAFENDTFDVQETGGCFSEDVAGINVKKTLL